MDNFHLLTVKLNCNLFCSIVHYVLIQTHFPACRWAPICSFAPDAARRADNSTTSLGPSFCWRILAPSGLPLQLLPVCLVIVEMGRYKWWAKENAHVEMRSYKWAKENAQEQKIKLLKIYYFRAKKSLAIFVLFYLSLASVGVVKFLCNPVGLRLRRFDITHFELQTRPATFALMKFCRKRAKLPVKFTLKSRDLFVSSHLLFSSWCFPFRFLSLFLFHGTARTLLLGHDW